MKHLHTIADFAAGALLLWQGAWTVLVQSSVAVSVLGGLGALLGLALIVGRVQELRAA